MRKSRKLQITQKDSNFISRIKRTSYYRYRGNELLKHYEQPTWSRRISRQHHLIYTIEDMTVTVIVLSAWGKMTISKF
ncbi:MAG: type II toxin-antitoxin system YoeB family toxin [Saprospiraceae bacterium]|nr:type II toxin-antitoxin system YoeB family toxin [Saprospiraceae bacterium]